MKPISDLGISPTPWRTVYNGEFIVDKNDSIVKATVYGSRTHANNILMAEAPNLYRDLYDAVQEFCNECEDTNIERCRGKCFVAKWRDTLARASGEEVAK